jgi:hypothetical protein
VETRSALITYGLPSVSTNKSHPPCDQSISLAASLEWPTLLRPFLNLSNYRFVTRRERGTPSARGVPSDNQANQAWCTNCNGRSALINSPRIPRYPRVIDIACRQRYLYNGSEKSKISDLSLGYYQERFRGKWNLSLIIKWRTADGKINETSIWRSVFCQPIAVVVH